MAKYEVLRGCHAEGFYPKGHQLAGNPIVYEPGDVLETENCLLKHNSRPGTQGALGDKFRLVDDDRVPVTDKIGAKPATEADAEVAEVAAVAGQPDDGLYRMSLSELKELARGDNIDLGTSRVKSEVVKVIRDAYAAA